MADPFVAEIRIFPFNFAPKGWAWCDGQLLPLSQNTALFSLLGTTYGGNGQTDFALPDFRGRTPIHVGGGFTDGQVGGEAAHTVNQSEMPQHVHVPVADTTTAPISGGTSPAATKRLASSVGASLYGPANNLTPMNPGVVSSVGGSQPHINMAPYLVLSFCICLTGLFPSRN
jgi:microcystin-dependent protein